MAIFDFSIKPIEALRNDLDRLTIIRALLDAPPVAQLVNLMNDLLSDDAMPFDIQWAYHDLAAAVLACHPPQVTGDRWRDNLITWVLERENIFSTAASKGYADDILLQAFARDLSIVQALFLLDDAMVRNWCMPSQGGGDLSNWTVFSTMVFYIVEGDGPLPTMRRMLLSSEDWSQLAKPLMDMHEKFGAGAVLGHRFLEYTGETLLPILRINSDHGVPDKDLLSALRRHENGENPGAVFIGGSRAALAARCALATSLLHIVSIRDISLYPSLCKRLEGTKTRFAVLLPASHPADPLLCRILGEGFVQSPENLLPILFSPAADPMMEQRFSLSLT